eukprot:Opistho-1_new@95705
MVREGGGMIASDRPPRRRLFKKTGGTLHVVATRPPAVSRSHRRQGRLRLRWLGHQGRADRPVPWRRRVLLLPDPAAGPGHPGGARRWRGRHPGADHVAAAAGGRAAVAVRRRVLPARRAAGPRPRDAAPGRSARRGRVAAAGRRHRGPHRSHAAHPRRPAARGRLALARRPVPTARAGARRRLGRARGGRLRAGPPAPERHAGRVAAGACRARGDDAGDGRRPRVARPAHAPHPRGAAGDGDALAQALLHRASGAGRPAGRGAVARALSPTVFVGLGAARRPRADASATISARAGLAVCAASMPACFPCPPLS